MTVFNCSNCNKVLKRGEREYCANSNSTECRFHELNNTRNIGSYNEWLRRIGPSYYDVLVVAGGGNIVS